MSLDTASRSATQRTAPTTRAWHAVATRQLRRLANLLHALLADDGMSARFAAERRRDDDLVRRVERRRRR